MAGIERSKMNMDSMSPAVQRRMVAVDTMMEGTSIESSGHPDADFLMMMVPHQQSAVDMARVVLKEDYGQTTETIGQKVIGAHEAESTGMTAMLDGMDK